MKAFVYGGPGRMAVEDRPKPAVRAPGDAIVKMVKTTICGTDLHILKGDVATCAPGRVLGHEGVGVVDSVGAGVTNFRPGDRVLISCISSCGRCDYCRRGMFSHCTTGGWVLGNEIDGTQAEYVRTPHADTRKERRSWHTRFAFPVAASRARRLAWCARARAVSARTRRWWWCRA